MDKLSMVKQENLAANKGKKFHLKRIVVIGLFVVSALLIFLKPSTETKPGWMLFPIYNEGLMAQNVGLWFAGRTYGSKAVYNTLAEATLKLREKYSGSKVAFMDVSGQKGGKIRFHLSHGKGIDVDILYQARLPHNIQYPKRPSLLLIGYLLKYPESGRFGVLRFDTERNWAFLMALRESGPAKAGKIFVESHIKQWLLNEGKRQGASATQLKWAYSVLKYAGNNAADHKDHMHIRFSIPSNKAD